MLREYAPLPGVYPQPRLASVMPSSPKPRLAIVGGGIGGLAFAVALSRLKLEEYIQIDIYEAAAKLTQVGAGITLYPRGWEILSNMGVTDDLKERLPPWQDVPTKEKMKLAFSIKKSDHKENVPMIDLTFPGGALPVHRADFQDILLNHISPAIRVHLGRRLTTYRELGSGSVELVFKDGDTAHCDLLVGADGVNSVVRTTMLANEQGLVRDSEEAVKNGRPVWTGTVVYRSLIDSEVIRKEQPGHPGLESPMVYCGKSKHIVSYPVSRGTLVNVVVFVSQPEMEDTLLEGPAVTHSTTDDVASLFTRWSDEAQCIIKNLNNPMRWAVETVRPLDKYAVGSVALLGDSAHAMTLHLGNGAGQAIEDAYILANILARAVNREQGIDISKITTAYSSIRQPFGNFVVAASRNQGMRYEFTAPGFEDFQEGDNVSPETFKTLISEIENSWDWVWNDSLAEEIRKIATFEL